MAMPKEVKNVGLGIAGFAVCAFLPWLGAQITDRVPLHLWNFPPPLDVPDDYPRFSWIACALVVAPLFTIAISWISGRRFSYQRSSDETTARRFPGWGWAAVLWTMAWWILAWTRLPWFAPLQRYTFFPLWLGFIVSVNALVVSRGAIPLMLRAPGRWALLFAVSAMFWWLFEWLNRFVRNWHYLGVEGIDAVEYAVHASLCFSTVLPAVTAVREWLGTSERLQLFLGGGPRWRWATCRTTAAAFLFAGLGGLIATGAYPLFFYPALWLAPLLLASGAAILAQRATFWNEIASGDWRDAGAWTMAALLCGCFWELWNVHSFAKWIYTVPFVDRWHIFEMPLLGYLGYLPFGLECALASAFFTRSGAHSTSNRSARGR